MLPELHLFIIWPSGRYQTDRILSDLKKRFDLLRVYELTWRAKHFSRNLARFYGITPPVVAAKEAYCGRGPFILVIVADHKPNYDKRLTSSGRRLVNINTFDAKALYREWTGGGHRIHASNDLQETSHDLTLLLGCTPDDFKIYNPSPWDGNILPLSRDLSGSVSWESLSQLFYVLNATTQYVVLRNFEELPESFYLPTHNDIDLLVSDYLQTHYITNSRPVFLKAHRVLNTINVNGTNILFDFRYLGDNYYDPAWERNILETRQLSPKGFYTPNNEDYFYSLLYHALVHKPHMARDYAEKLSSIAQTIGITTLSIETLLNRKRSLKLLNSFLQNKNYSYTKPADPSVFYQTSLKIRS